MKKKLINTVTCLLIATFSCYAQEKVEKYCEVTVGWRHKISVDYGNPCAYFRDSTIQHQLAVLTQLNSATAVLDYMSKIGWGLVSTSMSYSSVGFIKLFYFKKIFDKPAFTIDNNGN